MFIYYTRKGDRRLGKEKRRLSNRKKCVILSIWENHRAKGGYPSFFSEGVIKALQTKERRAIISVCYISGTNPDRNIHCCPCRSLL